MNTHNFKKGCNPATILPGKPRFQGLCILRPVLNVSALTGKQANRLKPVVQDVPKGILNQR